MTSDRRIGRTIWALSVATFINRATGFLGLFAAIFFTEIRVEAGALVTALLVVGVAGVGGSLLGGQLADRWGKYPVLLGSTAVNAALFVVLALADYSRTGWVVAVAAASVCTSQVFVGPASALVAESTEGRERVTRFAFYRIFINVGSIVAPALVGIIGRDHFDVLFWCSAVGSLVVPFVLASGFRGGASASTARDGATDPGSHHTTRRRPAPVAARAFGLPLVYVAMALAMVVYAQHQSAVPLRLETEPDGFRLYSLLLVINPVVVVLVEYPLSHVTKRIPPHLALSFGVLVMGAGLTVTGVFAAHAAVAVAGWVLFSVGETIFAPMSNTYVANLSSTSAQARSQGRLAAFQSCGAALGPAFGSWMLLSLSSGAWFVFLALTGISILLVLVAHRSESRLARRHLCQFS